MRDGSAAESAPREREGLDMLKATGLIGGALVAAFLASAAPASADTAISTPNMATAPSADGAIGTGSTQSPWAPSDGFTLDMHLPLVMW